jgi:hypothetical protein
MHCDRKSLSFLVTKVSTTHICTNTSQPSVHVNFAHDCVVKLTDLGECLSILAAGSTTRPLPNPARNWSSPE